MKFDVYIYFLNKYLFYRTVEPRVPLLEPIAVRISTVCLPLHGVGGFRRPPQGNERVITRPLSIIDGVIICSIYIYFYFAGRDGEGVRDRDRSLSAGHSGTRNDLRFVGPHRLSEE